jgi:formylglycine-generating enzyme required for sulfatase activity
MKNRMLAVASVLAMATGVHLQAGRNVPVVDFGDDYCWHGGVQGLPTYCGGENVVQLFKGSPAGDCPVDVDGDGSTDADSLAYYEFSLDRPFNPDGPFYNIKGNNARFYGGAVTFWANRRPNWTEGGINLDHELRDDFNLHSYATEGGKVGLRTFGLWLWKKEDFRNGGDRHPVSFDEESRIAVFVSRYWKEYEEGRFVVQDGERLYISEHVFGGATRTLYEVKPMATRWAEYTPTAPYGIEFQAASAKFATRTFADIRACGWYVAKPTLGPASLWLKWYAFGMDAVVAQPEAPSYLLAMQPLPGGGAVTASPVAYADWRKIHAWSNRNQYGMHEPYVYDRDGDMGTMSLDDRPHSAAEPVTDIAWLDAAAWCNALSEHEGRAPCLYTDPEFKVPLRRVMDRSFPDKRDARPEIHVKWAADGFRPATEAERPKGADGLFVVHSSGRPPADAADAIRQWQARYVPLDVASAAGDPGLAMVAIPGGTYPRRDGADVAIKPFFLASSETTFAQWKRVYAWALAHGYAFDRDGDLGSMDWSDPDAVFSQDEPVTQVSHNDIMVWCNALSEMQGRTPVYCLDPAKTQVYRRAHRFRPENTNGREAHYTLPDKGVQQVHVRWEADGYRLPTLWEWDYAYRAGNRRAQGFPWEAGEVGDHAWFGGNSGDRTRPVKGRQPNPWGLYDMAGNVFEWTLGGGESYYLVDHPRGENMPLAMGGSFRTDGAEVNALMQAGGRAKAAISTSLARAYPEIGFRVARCEAGTHSPEPPPYVPVKVLDFDPARLDAN